MISSTADLWTDCSVKMNPFRIAYSHFASRNVSPNKTTNQNSMHNILQKHFGFSKSKYPVLAHVKQIKSKQINSKSKRAD